MKRTTIYSYIRSIGLIAGFTLATTTSAELNVRDVNNSNPKQFVQHNDERNYWFAYKVSAPEDTRSMCCWKGGKYHDQNYGCDLTKKNYGFGSSSDFPMTDTVTVFTQIKNNKIKQLLTVGEHCPVTADGITVNWLHDVSNQDSISWLQEVIEDNDGEKASDNALYSLASHGGDEVTGVMYDLASNASHETAENAVFWLGQRKDGLPHLEKLYQHSERRGVRKKINFALSQNSDPRAYDLLKTIALEDDDFEQKKDAIFWLSQSGRKDTLSVLEHIVNQATHEQIIEQGVFAISQLDDDASNQALLDLVEDHEKKSVRKKALFWLAQSDPERTRKAAFNILHDNPQNHDWSDHVVFVLSQLPKPSSDDALFAILDGEYSKKIKKQALFWLSQSSHDETIERLSQRL
ncbi:HEAT repeat domain-containing protein [Marinicella sp. W31]|uniref:HEAT repeat domain-containing protein n=1 Tax=Marinicella sp. W31 TaxID=3023713 RepID=UPI0037576D82